MKVQYGFNIVLFIFYYLLYNYIGDIMIIKVLVENYIKTTDSILSYHVPFNLEGDIAIGKRVVVPLNKNEVEGFILEISKETPNFEVKDIISIVDDEPVLNKELLSLGEYIKSITLCSLISAYQVMLPSALKAKRNVNIKSKYKTFIKLNKSIEFINDYIDKNKRNKSEIALLNELINNSIVEKNSFNSRVANKLKDKDLIIYSDKQIYRTVSDKTYKYDKLILNKEQEHAVNTVVSALGIPKVFLLHGVTGSGKTETYLQIIEHVLKTGKNVIVLVPEISLTPQMTERFKGRFGPNVAVMHSSLSSGEKYDEWLRLKRGEAHIVVGARSAIFAPLSNIGLIVIDEEHETTYKQDSSPRYHALDIAKYRSKYHNCPIILGSATPSLESYARAKKNVYELLELKSRANGKKLPEVKIVDMCSEVKKKNYLISSILKDKINEKLSKNEQIILLLNRRGYSSFITCHDCGYVAKCPNCDISLTFHKTNNMLRCHYCGYATKMYDTCPECSGEIKNFGTGTEKVLEALENMFDAKIVRMDLDTTSKKGSHEKIIKDFETHKYDILLGTQMIAKGLDFSNVTLVGVINADTSLNIPDFRSGEVTFELLSQVSGRAGRDKLTGEVIIQTYNKDNYSIICAANHDYFSFYDKEMEIRRSLKYPPYYYLVNIKIMGKVYDDVLTESLKIKKYLKDSLSSDTIVLGPTTANMFKVNNIYRFQIIIKYKKDDKLYNSLILLQQLYLNKKITIDITFNPLIL